MIKTILRTNRRDIIDNSINKKADRGETEKFFSYDESTQVLWSLLHHTADLINKCEEAEFTGKAGISHQHFAILLMMEALGSPIREVDLARQLERSTNTISATLDCMERNGLIKKVRDVMDRRAIHIISTLKGRNKLKKATIIGWAMIQRLLASLSREEIELLTTALGKVTNNTYRELGQHKVRKAMPHPDYQKIVDLVDKH